MGKLIKMSVIVLVIALLLIGYDKLMDNTKNNQYNLWETLNNQSQTSKYYIFVDVEDSKLYLFENGELIKTYPCAGGKYTTPSPVGEWKIISKDTWGEGFGGRWMGINVPWGKFGIHGTIFPNSIGWSSSHGCIRMFNKDVKDLYSIVPHGTKVKITDGPYGAFGRGIRTLDPGEYGADVMEVQKKLKELGYYHSGIDGKYGEGMKAAVHKYQRDHNLPVHNSINRRMIENLGLFEFE